MPRISREICMRGNPGAQICFDGIRFSKTVFRTPRACFKTFLRQINRIQICTENVANTFVGGNHFSDVAFVPKSAVFPKLERYIDGFLSMNAFSPQQEWYMQIDEGSLLITWLSLKHYILLFRFILVLGKHLHIFAEIPKFGRSLFPQFRPCPYQLFFPLPSSQGN